MDTQHDSHTTNGPNSDDASTEDIHPIRASLARLPGWMQPFMTWLTGYALPGQKPLLPNSPAIQIAAAASTLVIAVGLGAMLGDVAFSPINFA